VFIRLRGEPLGYVERLSVEEREGERSIFLRKNKNSNRKEVARSKGKRITDSEEKNLFRKFLKR
jgi:hypothetical protein